jgi:hypothetical protein
LGRSCTGYCSSEKEWNLFATCCLVWRLLKELVFASSDSGQKQWNSVDMSWRPLIEIVDAAVVERTTRKCRLSGTWR